MEYRESVGINKKESNQYVVNQQEALEKKFRGMTDIPFTYENYETARKQLIAFVMCDS